MRAFIAVVALALGGLSCQGQIYPDDRTAEVRPALDSILAAHAEHFRTADIDALVGAYTENTVVRPAGMAPARGRAALRTAVSEWIAAAPVKSLAYATEDLSVFGDTAFHIASFKGTVQPRGSADMAIEGSCALVWVHDARLGWKVERSLCNSGPALTGSARP